VKTIQDGPARYKMTQQNLLPKFGAEKAGEPPAAEALPPAAEAAPEPAPPEPPASLVIPAEAGSEVVGSGPARAAAFVEASKRLRPFSGWSLFKNPFGRFLARKPGTAPRQIELSLDSVRPVRNDLSDFKPDGP
jgi:hypothetical protein